MFRCSSLVEQETKEKVTFYTRVRYTRFIPGKHVIAVDGIKTDRILF